MSTTVEKIALVVHPLWTYYRQELSFLIPNRLLLDKTLCGNPQEILDTFPELTLAQVGFLGLVAHIISGQDPLERPRITPEAAESPNSIAVNE